MFVARANKVEGTMSWCLGTNENSSGQGIKLEEASWQNNYIYCFIEWNNMIWVEIYLGSLIIFLEGNN